MHGATPAASTPPASTPMAPDPHGGGTVRSHVPVTHNKLHGVCHLFARVRLQEFADPCPSVPSIRGRWSCVHRRPATLPEPLPRSLPECSMVVPCPVRNGSQGHHPLPPLGMDGRSLAQPARRTPTTAVPGCASAGHEQDGLPRGSSGRSVGNAADRPGVDRRRDRCRDGHAPGQVPSGTIRAKNPSDGGRRERRAPWLGPRTRQSAVAAAPNTSASASSGELPATILALIFTALTALVAPVCRTTATARMKMAR